MNSSIFRLLLAVVFFAAASAQYYNLSLTALTLARPFSNIQYICCFNYAPESTLVVGTYPSGRFPEFYKINWDGSLTQWTNLTHYGQSELRVAAVQPGNPIIPGGWTEGDVFLGHTSGNIVKITENGNTILTTWVTIKEVRQTIQQTVFDRTGTVLGGDLIAVFAGYVYRINVDGNYSRVASGLNNYEGLDVVPNNPSRYGKLSGRIIIPQGPGYGSRLPVTKFAAIDVHGNISLYDSPCYTDQVFIVFENDNFYGLDYSRGALVGANWNQLKSLQGELIFQCETGGSLTQSGLYRVFWDFAKNNVSSEMIKLSKGSATVGYWEHACFAQAGVTEVLPGGFSLCMEVDNALSPTYGPILLPIREIPFYGYSNYIGNLPPLVKDHFQVSLNQDSLNGFYFQFVMGSSVAGHTLDVEFVFEGSLAVPMQIFTKDSPSDNYLSTTSGSTFSARFTWTLSGTSNGAVVGPISAIPQMKDFCAHIKIVSYDGPKASFSFVGVPTGAVNFTRHTKPLVAGATIDVCRVSCTCGDGVVDRIEDCDGGVCCTNDCKFKQGTLCNNTASTDPCILPSYCGNSGFCPPVTVLSTCNCSFPYTGKDCSVTRCNLLTNCNQCNAYPECGFCCDTGLCMSVNQTCKAFMPRGSCNVTQSQCNGGTLQCGNCSCPAGKTGDFCQFNTDCTGAIIQNGTKGLTFDVCNVCGGNGTSCLGCDGKPFGLKYDVCHVCGGDGTSCFNPCSAIQDCSDCNEKSDQCVWCTDGTPYCYFKQHTSGATCSSTVTNCLFAVVPPSVVVGASIGGGIIAAIVIGAVIFLVASAIGGKAAYNYLNKSRGAMGAVNSNPLFKDPKMENESPLYTDGQL